MNTALLGEEEAAQTQETKPHEPKPTDTENLGDLDEVENTLSMLSAGMHALLSKIKYIPSIVLVFSLVYTEFILV